MAYQNQEAFRDKNREELAFFKRQDPRPVLPSLGWMPVEGRAAGRFINSIGEQIDLWGGKNPGDFFAFNRTGVRGRPMSILDLALAHVGPGQDSFKKSVDLLRRLFGNGEPGDWTEGTSPAEPSDHALFVDYAGSPLDAAAASRIRRSGHFFRIPHQQIVDGGLKVVGWTDIGMFEKGDGTEERISGRLGIWSTPSAGASSIVISSELRDALRSEPGVMRVWAPKSKEGMAAQLVRLAMERIGCDHVTVAAPDTAAGDMRRGQIRSALDAAGIPSKGKIL